jgi:hypothetical protein
MGTYYGILHQDLIMLKNYTQLWLFSKNVRDFEIIFVIYLQLIF